MFEGEIIGRNCEGCFESRDVLSEFLIFSLLHAGFIFPLIIGDGAIDESDGNFYIFSGSIGRFQTDILTVSCVHRILYSFFSWLIAKIHIDLREISVRFAQLISIELSVYVFHSALCMS